MRCFLSNCCLFSLTHTQYIGFLVVGNDGSTCCSWKDWTNLGPIQTIILTPTRKRKMSPHAREAQTDSVGPKLRVSFHKVQHARHIRSASQTLCVLVSRISALQHAKTSQRCCVWGDNSVCKTGICDTVCISCKRDKTPLNFSNAHRGNEICCSKTTADRTGLICGNDISFANGSPCNPLRKDEECDNKCCAGFCCTPPIHVHVPHAHIPHIHLPHWHNPHWHIPHRHNPHIHWWRRRLEADGEQSKPSLTMNKVYQYPWNEEFRTPDPAVRRKSRNHDKELEKELEHITNFFDGDEVILDAGL